MNLDEKESPQISSKQCFTPIQSRTMYVAQHQHNGSTTTSISTTTNNLPMALCPSMDLVVLLAGNSLHTLLLHRTVSWQRLASKLVKPTTTTTSSLTDTTVTTATTADAGESSGEEDSSIQSVCWSPDGRSLAVGLSNQTIVLYHVETIGDNESSPMSSVPTSGASSESSTTTRIISTMAWSHVGRPHESWRMTPTEQLRNMTYGYQSKYYLDRSSRFLPGVYVGSSSSSEHSSSLSMHLPHSAHQHYSITTDTHHIDEDVDEVLQQQLLSPKCKTPLSLLSVATSDDVIHLYLHGRYPIGTLKAATTSSLPSLLLPRPKLCSSSDLQYLLYQKGSRLTCFHLPALSRHRYTLQIASALYSSMTFQLQTLQRHLHETLVCWKSSLKPLDMKLEAFQTVLSKYGVTDNLSKVLLSYIRFGQPQDDGPTNSALNQFFTSVQMNDQLMQRLEKSLHAALANVEGTCRKGVVRPARALVYDALQLVGLWTTPDHHNANTATLQLQHSVQSLYKMTELLLSQLVEARVRLHEFVAWLRSVAALIKHKTHHHNDTHKQRRVPQVVVHNVTKYLAASVKEDMNSATTTSTSVTERLVGLNVSLLCSDLVAAKKRPASPRVVHHHQEKSPTPLYDLVQRTQLDMAVVFEEPRTYVSRSLSQQTWVIETTSDSPNDVPMDIYSRIGCESHNATTEDCFHPRLAAASKEQDYSLCRNWALIARASSRKGKLDSVLLYAVPLGWNEDSSMDVEDLVYDDDVDPEFGPSQVSTPFYLVSRLALPLDCQIQKVSFYGDDGRSSLSSGSDSGTGKEGRQALGLLVRRSHEIDELWIVPYNTVEYQSVKVFNSSPVEEVVLRETDTVPTLQIYSLGDIQEDSQEAAVVAKTRRLSLRDDTKGSKLLLCGSRGVGAVCSTSQQHVTLNLFDLEEDEESEDEDDDEKMQS